MASDIDLDNEMSVTSGQIIQMLSSCDKDYIIDIPTILINNADIIDFDELINTAFEAGLGYSLLALIDVANKLEHNDAFYKVLSRQYPPNIEGNVIQDEGELEYQSEIMREKVGRFREEFCGNKKNLINC